MSTSTTSIIILERQRLEARLRAAVATATSQRLSTLAVPERHKHANAAGSLGDLEKRATAISEDRSVTRALEAANPSALRACMGLIETSRAAADRGQTSEALRLAADADRVLRRGLLDAAAVVARQEHAVAASVVADALKRIGCTATTFTGGGLTGIWAERGHQMVAVRIADGGQTMIDIAGCEAGECTPLHHELEAELADAGARLAEVAEVDHGDKRGGTLIQRAGAVAEKVNMAEGIVKAELSRFTKTSAQPVQRTRLGAV